VENLEITKISSFSAKMESICRRIPESPFKILDAPNLEDDYYLSLVDWSLNDVIAAALGNDVYLWSSSSSAPSKAFCLSSGNISSIRYSKQDPNLLCVGTSQGEVLLVDCIASKVIRRWQEHSARVGVMDCFESQIASGSRDRMIFTYDHRDNSNSCIKMYRSHRQEVCGLRWSLDGKWIASGGNDNKLLIWDAGCADPSQPAFKFSKHCAAVKAICWSPHQSGLLASGGGTADRSIRFWNMSSGSGTETACLDTESQVCNIIWSANVNEIVSTHGYSMNHILVWQYPSLKKVATLAGHSFRVLYLGTVFLEPGGVLMIFLAISPDGQHIVTGAGDQTLRIWNVFPENKSGKWSNVGLRGSLNSFTIR